MGKVDWSLARASILSIRYPSDAGPVSAAGAKRRTATAIFAECIYPSWRIASGVPPVNLREV